MVRELIGPSGGLCRTSRRSRSASPTTGRARESGHARSGQNCQGKTCYETSQARGDLSLDKGLGGRGYEPDGTALQRTPVS